MPSNGNTRWSVFSIIILSWLLVIRWTSVPPSLQLPETGNNAGAILRYIASTAFVKDRFTDPKIANIAGLPRCTIPSPRGRSFLLPLSPFPVDAKCTLATGIGYGFFIWAFMNILLLPVWNNKAYVFKAEPAIVNALILMAAIGLPTCPVGEKENMVNWFTLQHDLRGYIPAMGTGAARRGGTAAFHKTSFRVHKRIFATLDEKRKQRYWCYRRCSNLYSAPSTKRSSTPFPEHKRLHRFLSSARSGKTLKDAPAGGVEEIAGEGENQK